MQALKIYIHYAKTGKSLVDISSEVNVGSCKDLKELFAPPFQLYLYESDLPRMIKHIGGRAYLINDKFIWKYDEQHKANELSFITNLFAKACGLNCPDIVVCKTDYFIENTLIYEGPVLAQIVEYLPNWRNYTEEKSEKSNKFIKQLASILAFDLLVCNGDRFLFIWRLIDNIIFKNIYPKMDLWLNPIINTGNLGIIDEELWSLDMRAHDDIKYISDVHNLLTKDFLLECSNLMGIYFKLSRSQIKYFNDKLTKYIGKYSEIFPYFNELYNWVI